MLWNWTLRRTVRRNTVALTVSEKKYRELLTNLSIGIIVHDGKGAPNFWNKAALGILGLSADQLTGESAFPTGWEYISEQGERLTAASFPARIVIASGEPLLGRIVGIRKPNEKTRWFQVEAFPDFDSQGAIEQVVVTFFDITARRETEEKLLFISFHDALTGVHNRAYFEEELRRLDGRRSGALTIAVADVDGMKQVNDTWGHTKGDEILMRVAAVLRGSVRLEDVVARIGGDEFAIILRDADEATVESIFDRMSQSLEIERLRSDTEIPLSVSFGYAFAEGPGMSAVTLFQIADNRMYQDKAKRTVNRL
jgi:diguanylate cyclase (GGDEF)-like protein/PAS domain S-box-containing protein